MCKGIKLLFLLKLLSELAGPETARDSPSLDCRDAAGQMLPHRAAEPGSGRRA